MNTVLALIRGERDRDMIRKGLADSVTLRFCSRRAELLTETALAKPSLVISELVDRDRTSVEATLKSLRHRDPWLPIYLYIPWAIAEVRETMALLKGGIAAGAVFRGLDDPAKAISQILVDAQLAGETACLLRTVAPLMPPAESPRV